MPRSSVQASKTGDDTKSSQIPSKDNLVGEAMSVLFLIASVLYASSAHGCYTKYPTVSLFFVWVGFACVSFRNLTDQSQLLDEIKKLKEEIQIKSSAQVKAVDEVQDTKEPKPRKDHVKDQAVTINCLEVGEKAQVTKESEKPKQSVGKESEKSNVESKYEKSSRVWKRVLAAAEKGIKPKNPVCGAKKFQTFYVGNLSFKASTSDIKQAFETQLSMKVDSVIIARDSTGKSRGCAFVTMRWKEFHMRNTLYDRDKDSAMQDQGWSSLLTNIMNQQSICGRKIYIELARRQRLS